MKDLFNKVINNSTAVAVLMGAAMLSTTIYATISHYNKPASDYTCQALVAPFEEAVKASFPASYMSIDRICSEVSNSDGYKNKCVDNYKKVMSNLILEKNCPALTAKN